MASKEYLKGSVIESEGQNLSSIHLITQGSVKASFSGGEIILKKGDFIGLYDLAYSSHSFTYIAQENITLVSFSLKNRSSIKELCASNPEFAKMIYTSMVNELIYFLGYYAKLKGKCEDVYQKCLEYYKAYASVCSKNGIVSRSLPQFDNFTGLCIDNDIADWFFGYYASFREFSDDLVNKLSSLPALLYGFLVKASEDVHSAFEACEKMQEFYSDKMSTIMQENSIDLFDLYTGIIFRMDQTSSDYKKLSEILEEMVDYIKSNPGIESSLIHERVSSYLVKKQATVTVSEKVEEEKRSLEKSLLNSLDIIIEFADVEPALAEQFRTSIKKFKKLKDKTAVDDSTRKLRVELTEAFYAFYTQAFINCVSMPALPEIMKMFFNFGYVDEDLAGHENANYLYQIVNEFEGDETFGVYTIFEWLTAIYEKKKDPSRNEFDTDYLSYLHELRVAEKISAEEEKSLAASGERRLRFELENMFPIVNKITYGRLSIFTPVFCEHNVIKPLHSCLVTTDTVFECLRKVLAIDYSAFHRDTVYTNPALKITKEYISVKILPDVILTPNVGTRGSMWQEIEGRKRTTPARFVISAFHLEDISVTFTKLVGDYRWEMCKRIQGGRWNDVSDRSLTSEYFDYVQFYRKNNDLSPDAKDKIKLSLSRANNSFKEMFIRDYVTWVLYEGTGSPRLNKVSRQILCTYCPFPKNLRKTMSSNPLYKDLLEKYEIKTAQKLHHIDNVIQKINISGGTVPPELLVTRLFIEG